MLRRFMYCTLKKVSLGLLCLSPAISAVSQLSIGSSGALFIRNGTNFCTDSLVLIPSVDLNVSNNSIVKVVTPIPSPTPGVTSLARVYDIGAPITFSGTVGFFYQDGELGANTESLLQIAFNAIAYGAWTTTLGSTVNTSTNFVSNTITSQPIATVTATAGGNILPISYSGFFAQLHDQYVAVGWTVESTAPLTGFTIESSADGRNWQNTMYVPAVADQRNYSIQDEDLNFSIRYYRIAITDVTGETVYTNVAIVRKPAPAITVQIVSSGSGRVVNFPNATPDGIQLYDLGGRMLQKSDVSQSSYNLGAIPRGVYILRFQVAAEQHVQKIFLP